MSKFDKTFKENISQILAQPEWVPCRAHWEDGTQAKTKHVFGLVNRYDLREEIPVGTLRRLHYKNCIDEIIWIYLKKSNNIKDLNSHIWDQWADDNGSIGAAYGWQVANKLSKVMNEEYLGDGEYKTAPLFLDQMDTVLWKLKNNPHDRRIMIMLYSPAEEQIMGLPPCCYSCTFNVTVDKDGNDVLNLLLNQRSQDMIVANNWNVFQYSILLKMIANEVGMIAGELVHVIADAHIYDRHEDIAKHILELDTYVAPELLMEDKPFYQYTKDDFKLEGYKYSEDIKNIPVAI